MPQDGTPLSRYLTEYSERAGTELDYSSLIMAETGAVLSSPLGSPQREYSIIDLHDLLSPFKDTQFDDEWVTITNRFREVKREHGFSNIRVALQRERFNALTRLMKRKGILPMGMI